MTNSTRRRRGDETRGRLVAATVELVAEHGWDQVTTRQIARRADVNQALIGYHFGSRDQLLLTTAESALRTGFSAPVEALLAESRFVDGVVALIGELAAMDSAEPLMRFSMEAVARAPREEGLRQVMADLLAELRAMLRDGIVQAQRRGEIPRSVDPEGAAALLGGVFDGLGLHRLIDPELDIAPATATLRRLLSATNEEER